MKNSIILSEAEKLILNNLYYQVSELLETAKFKILNEANTRQIEAYFKIGKLIVEFIQKGNEKAEYGLNILPNLSKQLMTQYGRGYSVDNLERMRNFYLQYANYEDNLRKFKLSWSHYIFLLKIKDEGVRKFYEVESIAENWKLDDLKRQFNSGLYQRLALGRDGVKTKQLAEIGNNILSAKDLIKNNYILEFTFNELGGSYSESQLENALVNNLEKFLLELGKGFSFVGRQYRIGNSEEALRIDLVFYNRLLKSHVLIDLKIGELGYSDIGQMQVYKKYFDEEIKETWENKTIGLILAYQQDDFIIKYMPEDEYLFTSDYQLYLPSKEELLLLNERIKNQLDDND
jgi:predicted nuclease of restriction endonuclease-like (RecB) superfamily